jgi:hypothetical protein
MCNTTSNLDDAASLTDVPVMIETKDSANAKAEHEESMERIGALIQDLFDSDYSKVRAALDALNVNLDTDKEKCDNVVTAGGCFALVQLIKNRLQQANHTVNKRLRQENHTVTLRKIVDVIVGLTDQRHESKVAFSSIGAVEAVLEVMRMFPNCKALQSSACKALRNLADCSIGKKKAVKSNAMNVLLAAINNNLKSADVCEAAIWAMHNMFSGSKENTALLISLGGATAVAKVKTEWPDNGNVQTHVRFLSELMGDEMKTWAY